MKPSVGFLMVGDVTTTPHMNKSIAQSRFEAELAAMFSKMTSTEIRKMMNETQNTFIKLTCFEYLETL